MLVFESLYCSARHTVNDAKTTRKKPIQLALRLLRQPELEQDYERAWEEWAASGDQTAWDSTAGDGLADAAR